MSSTPAHEPVNESVGKSEPGFVEDSSVEADSPGADAIAVASPIPMRASGQEIDSVLSQLSPDKRDLVTGLIADRSYVEPRVATNDV